MHRGSSCPRGEGRALPASPTTGAKIDSSNSKNCEKGNIEMVRRDMIHGGFHNFQIVYKHITAGATDKKQQEEKVYIGR
jgi:hypothetical protein